MTMKPVSYNRIIDAAENIQLVMATTSHKGGKGTTRRIGFKLSNAEGFNRTILETFDLMPFVPGQKA